MRFPNNPERVKNIIFIKGAVVFNLLLAIKRFADINYVRVFKNI